MDFNLTSSAWAFIVLTLWDIISNVILSERGLSLMKKMGKEQSTPNKPVSFGIDTIILLLSYIAYLKYVAIVFVLIDKLTLGVVLLVAGYLIKLLVSKVCNKRAAKAIAEMSGISEDEFRD